MKISKSAATSVFLEADQGKNLITPHTPVDRGPTSWFRRATRCGSARLTCWWSAMGCYRCQARCCHNADPAVRAAWLNDMFLPPDVLEWALNVVVVRSGGRTILIDAGIGAEDPDFPRAGRLALRLEAAGIDPASVTDVVLTHLHMDHVGGLLADGVFFGHGKAHRCQC